jgi:hypothetical protein
LPASCRDLAARVTPGLPVREDVAVAANETARLAVLIAKLGELVRAEPYVEVNAVPGPGGITQLWVRLKPASG